MYIGIDLHKEVCYATTLDKEGKIIDRREFKNERALISFRSHTSRAKR